MKAPENPRQAGCPRTRKIPSGAESLSQLRQKVRSRCRRNRRNLVSYIEFIPLYIDSEAESCDVTQPISSRPREKRRRIICWETYYQQNKCPIHCDATSEVED